MDRLVALTSSEFMIQQEKREQRERTYRGANIWIRDVLWTDETEEQLWG